MKSKSSSKRSNKGFNDSQMKKIEMVFDFLIKFNILALPMYFLIYSGADFYPLQVFLTNMVYDIFHSAGYWIDKSGTTLLLFAPAAPPGPPIVQTIGMGVDCTGWKTIYAFMALTIATPVVNDFRKLRFMVAGSAALFVVNIVRILTTIQVAYDWGFQYLDIVHTLLWREGLIIVLLCLWFAWVLKQKNNISQRQTILRTLHSTVKKRGFSLRLFAYKAGKRAKRKKKASARTRKRRFRI